MKWGLGDCLLQLKPFPFFFSENNGMSGEDTIKEQAGKDVSSASYRTWFHGGGRNGVTRRVEVETGAIVAPVEGVIIGAAYVPT